MNIQRFNAFAMVAILSGNVVGGKTAPPLKIVEFFILYSHPMMVMWHRVAPLAPVL